jgi:serine/threonine protein kinase
MANRRIYFINHELCSEGTNIIYVATEQHTGKDVIIKVPKTIGSYQPLIEAAILRHINHPGIITLLDIVETVNGIGIVLPFYPIGDLFDLMLEEGTFSETDVKMIIFRLLTVLTYLHSCRVVHRDIKPENIYLASGMFGDLILADFGLAGIIPEGSFLDGDAGTPPYIAPEIWEDQQCTEKADIWSLGITMYLLLTHIYLCPLQSGMKPRVAIAVMHSAVEQLDNDESLNRLSQVGRAFLKELLKMDPSERITAAAAMNHEWFQHTD